jgi:hypothetical protein
MLAGEVADDEVGLFLVYAREDAVIRSDKVLVLTADEQRTPLSANAGIDDNNVNGAGREKGIGGSDSQGAVKKIEGRNLVSDVDDRSVGINLEDDALEHGYQVIVRAVVRGQRDEWIGQVFPFPMRLSLLVCGLAHHLTLSKRARDGKKRSTRRYASANVTVRGDIGDMAYLAFAGWASYDFTLVSACGYCLTS